MNRIELRNTDDYHSQQAADTLSYFEVSPEQGLSKNEAQARLETFGPMKSSKRRTAWHRIFRRFWGPIPWMIEIAALLSAIVQKWEDFVVILIMLLINVVLDFFQEHRALNALKVLKQQVSLEVRACGTANIVHYPPKNWSPATSSAFASAMWYRRRATAQRRLSVHRRIVLDRRILTGHQAPRRSRLQQHRGQTR